MEFSQVEAEYGKLKAQYEAGTLAEAEFRTRLEELMIEDEPGRWWTIGATTGQWYYHAGEKWMPGEPPRSESEPWGDKFPILLTTIGGALGLGIGGFVQTPIGWAIGGAIAGLLVSLALWRTELADHWMHILAVVAGWACGGALQGVVNGAHGTLGYLGVGLGFDLGIAWAVGGLSTGLVLRWARQFVQWKPVLIMTIGWAIAGAMALRLGGTIAAAFAGADKYWWQAEHWSFPNSGTVYAVVGMIAGAAACFVGGWVMFWQIREARRSLA
jgi:hypothetical protein